MALTKVLDLRCCGMELIKILGLRYLVKRAPGLETITQLAHNVKLTSYGKTRACRLLDFLNDLRTNFIIYHYVLAYYLISITLLLKTISAIKI